MFHIGARGYERGQEMTAGYCRPISVSPFISALFEIMAGCDWSTVAQALLLLLQKDLRLSSTLSLTHTGCRVEL
jgi:hypothetical protein